MKPLTGRYARIVYHGEDWSEHYAKKVAARSAVILHALHKDWTFQDCELVLLDFTNPGSDLWLTHDDGRALGRTESWKRLKRDYDRMAKRKQDHPGYKTKQDVRGHIAWLKMQAAYWPWKSRYDRDVLAVFHNRASELGCDRVNVSTRQASLAAGCARQTATNAIGRLIKAGWLERVEDDRAASPADTGLSALAPRRQARQPRSPLYRLTRPKGCVIDGHITSTAVGGENNMATEDAPSYAPPDMSHECWVQLGKMAMDIHFGLTTIPISGREAARRAKASEKSARLVLPKLAEYGLAKKTEAGWIKGPCSPDQVVVNMGWVGLDYSKTEQRMEDYKRDRANYPYLGQDGALNDPKNRQSARSPLWQARAKASSASPVVPEAKPFPKCSLPDCDDYDSGRGLCYSHQAEEESQEEEKERASPLRSGSLKQWAGMAS